MSDLWAQYFEPIAKLGWEVREGQAKLGNAIIRTLDHGGTLVGQAECGTGKSLAALIPIIMKIRQAKIKGDTYRAVISTETLTLQRQLDLKDLPFLLKKYGGFTYKKLMGRSNYVCFNHAREESIGNPGTAQLYNALDKKRHSLGAGEKEDAERVLGRKIPADDWSRISGSSEYCSDADCSIEECFSSLAREQALSADIVVANHMILAIDFELKQTTSPEGMLGPLNAIVVDEAHKLEEVLSNQWTTKYTGFEVSEHLERLIAGMFVGKNVLPESRDYRLSASSIQTNVEEFFKITRQFFTAIEEKNGRKWDGSENAFCMQFVARPDDNLRNLMLQYEAMGPAVFKSILDVENDYSLYLFKVLEELVDSGGSKTEKQTVRKARTSLKFLTQMAFALNQAMESKDGIVRSNGMVSGMTVTGWEAKSGALGMSIQSIPIDLSEEASKIWKSVTSSVIISATLEDLSSSDKNFKYFKRSLGIPESREIRVESPFTMARQQLVYVSDKKYEPEEGTVFSVEEIVDSVNASNGRALILFTSRRDLDMANQMLLQYKVAGRFPYIMYVQTPEADKAKLVDDFKGNTASVLLGLKSMFTGIDIPGDSLSNVIICRFPLARFSVECKMKITYWRSQGFPNWYERDSLTVFQQAAGRLIRSEECIGVVSILDQRVSTAGTNVFKTASKGISALGSRVTINMNDVHQHLGALSEV